MGKLQKLPERYVKLSEYRQGRRGDEDHEDIIIVYNAKHVQDKIEEAKKEFLYGYKNEQGIMYGDLAEPSIKGVMDWFKKWFGGEGVGSD